jgi:hypothetical protein
MFNSEPPSYVACTSPYDIPEGIAHKEKVDSVNRRIGDKRDWLPSSSSKAKRSIARDTFLHFDIGEKQSADPEKIASNLKHFNEKLRKQKYTSKSRFSDFF